jgi:16S rRNA G966 N2-methylase RsmD
VAVDILQLTRTEVQRFIREHAQDDPLDLMLKASRFPEIPMREVAEQIQARQKARIKLPEWYQQEGVLFPPALSVEQASSDSTAKFKAGLISGRHLVDLTGGMGVDTFYLGRSFATVDYVERQEKLVALAKHNFRQLGGGHIRLHHAKASDFLQELAGKVDCIYLDPARRDEQGSKVFKLQDCSPNVVELKQQLLARAGQILIKAAPLLDIQSAIRDLEQVSRVWVVSVKNECKEVLYLLEPGDPQDPLISTVNLLDEGMQQFDFKFSEEADAVAEYSVPQAFLYEPNASLLKAGAFQQVAITYDLAKLHPNSHLYTSDHLRADFPGRVFQLVAQSKYHRKALRALVPDGKANMSVRNFPESVQQIRKKTGIRDGGDLYVFATTIMPRQRSLLICRRVSV